MKVISIYSCSVSSGLKQYGNQTIAKTQCSLVFQSFIFLTVGSTMSFLFCRRLPQCKVVLTESAKLHCCWPTVGQVIMGYKFRSKLSC